jgi:hypothetical protein
MSIWLQDESPDRDKQANGPTVPRSEKPLSHGSNIQAEGSESQEQDRRAYVATDHRPMTFSGAHTLEGITWLLDRTLPGSEITAEFGAGKDG